MSLWHGVHAPERPTWCKALTACTHAPKLRHKPNCSILLFGALNTLCNSGTQAPGSTMQGTESERESMPPGFTATREQRSVVKIKKCRCAGAAMSTDQAVGLCCHCSMVPKLKGARPVLQLGASAACLEGSRAAWLDLRCSMVRKLTFLDLKCSVVSGSGCWCHSSQRAGLGDAAVPPLLPLTEL